MVSGNTRQEEEDRGGVTHKIMLYGEPLAMVSDKSGNSEIRTEKLVRGVTSEIG